MPNCHYQLSTTQKLNQFDSLFITKVDQPLQIFDLFVKIKVPSNAAQTSPGVSDGRSPTMAFAEDIYRTLKKALGERAKLINIQLPKLLAWKVTPSSTKSKTGSILVGIMCDPAKASQGREFGPLYEQKKDAAKFREFWGDIAELWQVPLWRNSRVSQLDRILPSRLFWHLSGHYPLHSEVATEAN